MWGIGLNYVDHAADLSETAPDEPASFIKGDHTIIGPGDDIPIPPQSERTTAEGELGLVIGRHCRNVSEEDALDHVFGVDHDPRPDGGGHPPAQPAVPHPVQELPGLLLVRPRDRAASAAVLERFGRIEDVEVSTVVNGEQTRTNTVERMMHGPAFLVAFHSAMMPLYPGDIISTGTPGAIHVRPGDVAECRIPGIGTLVDPVVAGCPGRYSTTTSTRWNSLRSV